MPKNSNHKKSRSSARSGRGRQRRLSVRSELRQTLDVGKIARAVVAMAIAQAEAEAEASEQKAKNEADEASDREDRHA